MRTLIIDNYDSFTYNLFQLIATTTGELPVVVRNDDISFDLESVACFDNVVISPGPGRPDISSDFGISRTIIETANRPLLGVCLGHQGICHLAGGIIERAPTPMHGRLSLVFHRQTALLAGIPSPFQAVRYHSLVASNLPPELDVQAETEDGILMAVAHRVLPYWGVQFHPESICTQYGARILTNFAEMTAQWHRERGSAFSNNSAPRSASRQRARQDGPAWRIETRTVCSRLSTERVFEAFYGRSQSAFWLDSSCNDPTHGRFSFMGDASGPNARVLYADVAEGMLTIDEINGHRTVKGSLFDWLEKDLHRNSVAAPTLPFDFALGWVGYLGYELKAECGGQAPHRSQDPDAALIFADRAIAFDHERDEIWLLALAPNHRPNEMAIAWLDEALRALNALDESPVEIQEADIGRELDSLVLRHERNAYLDLIERCQAALAAGESYEICLTNMVTARGSVPPLPAYRKLRKVSPAPFAAFLRFDELAVLSSSPERFLCVGADRTVEAKPIKGTRPRGNSAAEDRTIRDELATCEKDRAENLMIVDLLRNDIGSCAEVGSVTVDKIFDVETYATVHQLVSTIRARLSEDFSTVDCVRAAFPGGSMTGAPKIRTMAIIDELEAGPRGVYSGALGYFSLNGAADLSIVIRTLVVRPNEVQYGVGGAIIALSDAKKEYEETVVKTTPLLLLLDRPFPGARLEEEDRTEGGAT